MAFHVACPITCRRICFCGPGMGFGRKAAAAAEEEVGRVERFVAEPWSVRAAEAKGTVEVVVPRVRVEEAEDEEVPGTVAAAMAKRAELQRSAVAASVAAEDYVRRLEMGAVADEIGESVSDLRREDQVSSAFKVICRICFSGESEGSEKATKMLSCKSCHKKYHKSCLKSWSEHRDLFHWSSWACPSCRACEICKKVGDPSKFMFCKRCDGAYHCYCQQPPHKNVSHGPYLCPKHTRCHSCSSTVHGSGHSTRWFLGYNFCDACGRLFMKDKYCPVCLKVYRDSESTPMVCCDVCQRWVHCLCDGISDEKYMQFQADGNLYYKCAACRGECYQVTDVDDAVQELWRRRDKADRDMIANLRAVAGLPTQEDYYSVSPYSDAEENGPVLLKSSDIGRSLKFSLKGLSDKTTKSVTEQGKKANVNPPPHKSTKKKVHEAQLDLKTEETVQNLEKSETRLRDGSFVNDKDNNIVPYARAGSGTKMKFSLEKHESLANNAKENSDHIKETSNKSSLKEDNKRHDGKNEPVKGTKLVIHLGGRNRKFSSSPLSEASSCHRDQENAVSNGSEDSSQQKTDNVKRNMLEAHTVNTRLNDGKGAELDNSHKLVAASNPGKDVSDGPAKAGGSNSHQPTTTTKKTLIFRRRKTEVKTEVKPVTEDTGNAKSKNNVDLQKNNSDATIGHPNNDLMAAHSSLSNSLPKDSRPLLKLKFKNPYLENNSSSGHKEEERSIVKGQRSKRKRRSPLTEKGGTQQESCHGDSVDEAMDANWILRRLGKNAIGKRVEVHQPSDNSWQKGVVVDVAVDTLSLSVNLDDGRSRRLELGKQGVRFIPQKQKRTKL